MRILNLIITILLCGCLLSEALTYPHENLSEGKRHVLISKIADDGSMYVESPYILWNENLPIGSNSAEFSEPFRVDSANGLLDLTLYVRAIRLQTPLFSINTRAFCLEDRCSVPGPSIYVSPGDKVKIKLINELEQTGDSTASINSINSTNIYISGISLNQEVNSIYSRTDATTKSIEYEYQISSDESLGVHLYQSFVPGVSAAQGMGGLVGAFVVRSSESTVASSDYKALHALKKILLVLTHFMAGSSQALIGGTNQDDSFTASLSYSLLSSLSQSTLPLNLVPKNPKVIDAWFTNGLYQPVYTLQSKEWQVFEIVVASVDRFVDLRLLDASQSESSCSMKALATDGIYLKSPRTFSHMTLAPGSRLAVAVYCPHEGTYYLSSMTSTNPREDTWIVGDFETKSIQTLMVLKVEGVNQLIFEPPTTMDTLSRPSILDGQVSQQWMVSTDLNGASTISQDTFHALQNSLPLAWFGLGKDCTIPCFNSLHCLEIYGDNHTALQYPTTLANFCRYEHNQTFVIKNSEIDSIQQIKFFSNEKTRVISIQGVYFQFMSHDDGTGKDQSSLFGLSSGDWRESLLLIPGTTTVRMKAFQGKRAIFSRLLKYTDRGMLASVRGIAPSTNNNNENTSMKNNTNNNNSSSNNNNNSVINSDVGPSAEDMERQQEQDKNIANQYVDPRSASDDLLCHPHGNSFRYSETVDMKKRVRRIATSSCPNHFSICQRQGCSGVNVTLALVSDRIYEVPLYPMFSKSPKDMTCTSQAVGIALNGVKILSPNDEDTRICGTPGEYGWATEGRTTCPRMGQDDGTLYCGDSVKKDMKEMDKCGGHADNNGDYHYHVVPSCLLLQMESRRTSTPATKGHSPQVGWALDGFPIYGPRGPKGIVMARCGTPLSHPTVCLDRCNGYHSALPGYDSYLYRYYMTGPMSSGQCSSQIANNGSNSLVDCDKVVDPCCVSQVPDESFYPYSLGCLRGCQVGDDSCKSTGVKGTLRTYLPGVSLFANDTTDPSNNNIDTDINNSNNSNNNSSNNNSNNSSLLLKIQAEQRSLREEYQAMQSRRIAAKRFPVSDVSMSGQMMWAATPFVARNAANRSISIAQYQYASNDSEAYTWTNNSSINNSSINNSIISSSDNLILTLLPTGSKDFFITGLAMSKTSNTSLFIASETGVFTLDTESQTLSEIVSGYLEIAISGYNFGVNVDEVIVTLDDVSCTSLVLYNTSSLSCVYPWSPWAQNHSVHTSQVTLSIKNRGLSKGVSPDPLTEYMSGSGRPVIADMILTSMAWVPHAVDHLVHEHTSADVVYYANIATSGFNIQRCFSNRSQAETVVHGVQSVQGIAVATWDSQSDVLLFTEAITQTLSRIILPTMLNTLVFENSMNYCGRHNTGNESLRYVCDNVIGKVMPLIDMLETGTSIVLDQNNGFIFLTTFSGVLVRFDYDRLMRFGVETYLSSSVSRGDWTQSKDYRPMSFKSILDESTRPDWIHVVFMADTKTRTSSLTILPFIKDFQSPENHWFTQSRVLMADTNAQRLISIGDNGFDVKFIDIGMPFGHNSVQWPSAVQGYIHDFQQTANSSKLVYTIRTYVAEYLGKVWRVDIEMTIDNSPSQFNNRPVVTTPTLLLDKSQFPVSNILRQHLSNAQIRGEPSYRYLSFEILV